MNKIIQLRAKVAILQAKMLKAFDESKHPRGEHGRWSSVSLHFIGATPSKYSFMADASDDFEIRDNGKVIGTMRVDKEYDEDDNLTSIEVANIGGKSDELKNKLGPTVIRSFARKLKEYYPEANKITGFRVSGARRGATASEGVTGRNVLGWIGANASLNTKLIKQLQIYFGVSK